MYNEIAGKDLLMQLISSVSGRTKALGGIRYVSYLTGSMFQSLLDFFFFFFFA